MIYKLRYYHIQAFHYTWPRKVVQNLFMTLRLSKYTRTTATKAGQCQRVERWRQLAFSGETRPNSRWTNWSAGESQVDRGGEPAIWIVFVVINMCMWDPHRKSTQISSFYAEIKRWDSTGLTIDQFQEVLRWDLTMHHSIEETWYKSVAPVAALVEKWCRDLF